MLDTAISAALEAGKIMREYANKKLQVDDFDRYDIKLEVDKCPFPIFHQIIHLTLQR